MPKVEFIWEPALNQLFTGFPAKIWIFKFRFSLTDIIKMITFKFKEVPVTVFSKTLENFDGTNHEKNEFKNSNFGGKYHQRKHDK